MPADIQEGIMWGSEMTAHQNLPKFHLHVRYAMSELAKAGVEFHSLSEDQLDEWKAAGGYHVRRVGRVQDRACRFHGQLCARWKKRLARRANTTSTTPKQTGGAPYMRRPFLPNGALSAL